MSGGRKPRLFIGSSAEGLDVAYAIQENLEFDTEATVWSQGVFAPTSTALVDLLKIARATDFAAFIFTPDDVRIMRETRANTPRDNVIFELGLLIGARGPERCFFVMPRDQPIALPSDILGLTALGYASGRHDGNIVAALGPAANKIRRVIREMGAADVAVLSPAATRAPADPLTETAELVQEWNEGDLAEARRLVRQGVPMHFQEDEDGHATKALLRLFIFLERMADGVLVGRLDESAARVEFAGSLAAVWKVAHTYLAPLNHADDFWNPIPRVAELDQRWKGQPR